MRIVVLLIALLGLLSAVPAVAGAEPPAEITREYFTTDDMAPRHEPKGYDVTIVEYSDYQCPYCRKIHPVLQSLVAKDRKVRILYRDWPIFGPQSEYAARLAIASKYQGKHAAFHDALMTSKGKLDEATIKAAAKKARVDWKRLEADYEAHRPAIEELVAKNDFQANALELQGTPAFIVGDTLVRGVPDLDYLQELVAEARAK